MELRYEPVTLQLKTPFRIAHGTSVARHNVLVRIRAGGQEGIGEAAPVHQHGESQAEVLDYLSCLGDLGADPFRLEEILSSLPPGPQAARAAIDIALHDLVGKILDIPLYRFLGLTPARAPVTCLTLGMASPEEIATRARAAGRRFTILKLKLADDDAENLAMARAAREASAARLVADANCAWTLEQALRLLPPLAALGLEWVEQPLAENDLAGMAHLRQVSPLPIFADEPLRTAHDVPRLAGCCDGVNVKVQKAGGLREAVRAIAVARAHGLHVMLGCMVETSVGITAAAHLAPLVDWADLDGTLHVANDPFTGVEIEAGGRLRLPSGPGLGIAPRPERGEA